MKTADPELMRSINRFSVLDTIRRSGAIARIEISEKTQLSTTTVSAITASLLDDGLIITRTEGDLRSVASRGRPRVMLELNPDAARVVGAKIMANRMVFAVTNFRGEIISTLTLALRLDRQPISVIADLIEDGIRHCVVEANLSLKDIETVCLGMPGLIERRTGRILSSPIFQEQNVDFSRLMSDRLGIMVIVESDAHAITLCHHWFGKARDLDDVVLISLHHTLGLGVLHGGKLFRGAGGLSHELGDLVLRIGKHGTVRLSSVVNQSIIFESDLSEKNLAKTALSDNDELAKTQDSTPMQAARHAGTVCGMTIANIVTLFAPPRVIFVGPVLPFGPSFLESLKETYAMAIPSSLLGITELVFEQSPDEAWAQGAAIIALCELYEAPWGTTGPASTL